MLKPNRKVVSGAAFVSLQPTKIVLGRRSHGGKEYPHLTIMTHTASGELDIHLTWTEGREKRYESLVKISREKVVERIAAPMRAFEKELKEFVWRETRWYRPGWLNRKGFFFIWQDSSMWGPTLRKFAPLTKGAGPRRGKKKKRYELDWEGYEAAAMGGGSDLGLHTLPASLLRFIPGVEARLAAEGRLQVHAICLRRRVRRRRGDLVLFYEPNTRRWYGMRKEAVWAATRRALVRHLGGVLLAATPALNRLIDVYGLGDFDVEPLGEELWRRLGLNVQRASEAGGV